MKNKQKTNRQRGARRRGTVIVMVSCAMVLLCGACALAVDYGLMLSTRNQLQRACDAGALAAVKYLPLNYENSRDAAVFVGYQNGGTAIVKNTISFPTAFRVTVPAARNVNFFFARVLGKNSGTVSARATAAVQMRDFLDTPAVVPLGITPETYAAGLAANASINVRLIEQNKEGLGLNELVTFDLRDGSNGKSPAKLEEQLSWDTTFQEPTYIGNPETTLNSDDQAQSHATDDGLQTRIQAALAMGDNGNRYPNIPYGSPLVMYFIITPANSGPITGTNQAPVLGFAPMYAQGINIVKSGGTTTVTVTLRALPPNYDTGHATAGGAYTDATGTSPAALQISRLVE